MEHVIGGKFRLGRKIGSGSFGELYLGMLHLPYAQNGCHFIWGAVMPPSRRGFDPWVEQVFHTLLLNKIPQGSSPVSPVFLLTKYLFFMCFFLIQVSIYRTERRWE
jgi:hypothetical protein